MPRRLRLVFKPISMAIALKTCRMFIYFTASRMYLIRANRTVLKLHPNLDYIKKTHMGLGPA